MDHLKTFLMSKDHCDKLEEILDNSISKKSVDSNQIMNEFLQ